jgi:hypothetical protein
VTRLFVVGLGVGWEFALRWRLQRRGVTMLASVIDAVWAGISGVFMKGRVTRLFPVCSKFVPAIPDGSNNGLDQTGAPVC